MTKRIGIIGVVIVGGGLLTGLWLHNRKPASAPGSVKMPDESRTVSSPAKSLPAVARADYQSVFAGIDSREWLPLEAKASDDDLFSDARYCNYTLACLISAGDLEWGSFLAQSGLTAAGKRIFVELTAKKKLALKQASIASRAFGADAGKNGRTDFLQSVSAEYDAQIKKVAGEANFSAYQAYEDEGAATVLEPFFAEVSALGFPLNVEQEKKLTAKIAGLPKIKGRAGRDFTNAFLSFDAAADESVELSLDQVLVLREYQEALRSSRKPPAKTVITASGAAAESTNAIRLWSVANFSKKAAKELSLDAAKRDALRLALGDLLSGRIQSNEFQTIITALIETDGLTKLIALAEKSAVERNLNVIDRKFRVAGLSLTEAQREKLRSVLDLSARQPATSAQPTELSLDFLAEDARGLVERHQRARLAALTLHTRNKALAAAL